MLSLQSVDVIIEQKFHSQLIGAKGAHIREMIEQFGGISFIFPKSTESSDIVTYVIIVVWISRPSLDVYSYSLKLSLPSYAKSHPFPQCSLRGDKKNVDAAEKFLKSEVKRLIESNFTLEVSLYSQFVKHIIGRAGATLNQIKADTETRIKIPKDAAETTIITITGACYSLLFLPSLSPVFVSILDHSLTLRYPEELPACPRPDPQDPARAGQHCDRDCRH